MRRENQVFGTRFLATGIGDLLAIHIRFGLAIASDTESVRRVDVKTQHRGDLSTLCWETRNVTVDLITLLLARKESG